MSLVDFVPHFLGFLASYKYVLLFVGIVIEGPILMVASGLLIHAGFFELTPAFWVIVVGDLTGDVVWYYVGYYFAEPMIRKHGHFLKITPEMLERAKKLFNKYHVKILLISKVTIGFGGMALATLMTAGAMRVSFKKYMSLNLLGELFLVGGLLALGYFFGQLYNSIADAMKIYFVVGVILGVSGLIYYFSKRIKKELTS